MNSRVDCRADLARRRLLAMTVMAPGLAAAIATAAESAPSAAATPAAGLAEAVSAYDRATIGRDIAALGDIVADDYLLVNSDASVQNKLQYLADFELPGFSIDPYMMEEPMQKVWGNAALTGGLLRLGWRQDGEQHSRLLRIAHVWARHGDQWRLTYTQLTRVPQ